MYQGLWSLEDLRLVYFTWDLPPHPGCNNRGNWEIQVLIPPNLKDVMLMVAGSWVVGRSKNLPTCIAQQKHTRALGSMKPICLPTWMVDFYGTNVSEYTSSMDTMGHGKIIKVCMFAREKRPKLLPTGNFIFQPLIFRRFCWRVHKKPTIFTHKNRRCV